MNRSKFFACFFLLAFTLITATGCSDDGGNSANDFSHTADIGSSAHDFLSAETYTRLLIEIDYVEGFEPEMQSLLNLRTFLSRHINKPLGIEIIVDDKIPSPGLSPYTSREAFETEQSFRDYFTESQTIAAYILILDGEFENQAALGFTYFNTSVAVMGEKISQNSGGAFQAEKVIVESTILNHEFGHLLGLVDNGSPMIQDHLDEDHIPHCDVETCLMFFSVRTSGFMNNFTGGEIPQLDPQCIQDLQANGGR